MAAVLRAVFGYLFLVLMVRVVGRRPGKQMAPFDYVLGTLIGGVGASLLFGVFIASGSRWHVSIGYFIGAALMLAGALCEWGFGVEAAGKSLESVSKPIQSG